MPSIPAFGRKIKNMLAIAKIFTNLHIPENVTAMKAALTGLAGIYCVP
jgi:hypothetical protein